MATKNESNKRDYKGVVEKKEFKWWENENLSNIVLVKEFEDYFRILSNNNPGKVADYIKSNSIPFKDIISLVGFIDYIVKESKESTNLLSAFDDWRLTAADITNKIKKAAVGTRRDLIKAYLKENPNPETKGFSIETHLIKKLNLKVKEKTVSNDLKEINSEKR